MNALPLIISGPMVRDVSDKSVSVWIALSSKAIVHLDIYALGGSHINASRAGGTIRLAENVHLCVVTVDLPPDCVAEKAGSRCHYNLRFQTIDGPILDLFDVGVLTVEGNESSNKSLLTYSSEERPSFRILPHELTDLRLAHASCRKPHGPGKDAFGILDEQLADSLERFDVLFLTGDQIYADDVHPMLLNGIHHVARLLTDSCDLELDQLKSIYGDGMIGGHRDKLVKAHASFTSTHSDCHLITFMEFVSMYLLVWSDSLWEYIPQTNDLADFRETLPAVRRVLANTATYMIFDDHEITDDWNRTGAWLTSMSDSALGPRIVTNGLGAYNFFQHWGNVPERFTEGSTELKLLKLTESWTERVITDDKSMASYWAESLNVKVGDLQTLLDWSYTKEYSGYRVVAVDSRTRREYPSETSPPGLMSTSDIERLLYVDTRDKKPMILLSAAPVLGLTLLEGIQTAAEQLANKYGEHSLGDSLDLEAWSHHAPTHYYLLQTLWRHERVVVLSGDVHYAFGSTLVNNESDSRIVNFVSSSTKNQFFSKSILSHLQSVYLSAEGGASLEGKNEGVFSEGASVSRNTIQDDWVEELIIDPVPEDDISLESVDGYPEGRRRAAVIGSTNVGLVAFTGNKTIQTVIWKLAGFSMKTPHEATFKITKVG